MNKYFLYTLISLSTTLTIFSQDSINKKIGNYIKFNIEIGAVANSPFCNVPRHTTEQSHFENTYYTDVSSDILKFGLTGGVNFIFGHKKVKAILGLSYLQSNCEYHFKHEKYSAQYGGRWQYDYTTTSEITDIHNKGIVHYLNTNTGMRFYFKKGFRFEITVSANAPFYFSVRTTGAWDYKKTESITDSTFASYTEHKDYNGSIQHENLTFNSFSVSLRPKFIYSLFDHNKPFDIFFSRNISLTNKTPWWVLGINYYPFKELR